MDALAPNFLLGDPLDLGRVLDEQKRAVDVRQVAELSALRGASALRLVRDAIRFLLDEFFVPVHPRRGPVFDFDHADAGWLSGVSLVLQVPSVC